MPLGPRRRERSEHFQQKMIAGLRNLLGFCDLGLSRFLNILRQAEIPHLAGDFLSGLLADVVELGAADLSALQHLDAVDNRREEGENLLYPDTGGDTADGKGRPGFGAVLPREDETLEGLETGLPLLLDLLPDADGVARAKVELLALLDINR